MTKREKYHKLIADVREDYSHRHVEQTSGGPKLLWCKECEREINLWTYWQNSLDAKIMLVGQDWGSPWDDGAKETMQKIQRANVCREPFFPVLTGKNVNPTDSNLEKLFHVLGYDVTKKEPDLFFTNLIFGYRDHGTSGPFRQKWIRDDAPYFKRLAEIIEPEVMICLGKSTFEGVVYALTGQMKHVKGFNRFLDSGDNYQDISLDSGQTIRVYAVAHCGTIGTMNRNRGNQRPAQKISSADISRQVEDWGRIRIGLSKEAR